MYNALYMSLTIERKPGPQAVMTTFCGRVGRLLLPHVGKHYTIPPPGNQYKLNGLREDVYLQDSAVGNTDIDSARGRVAEKVTVRWEG